MSNEISMNYFDKKPPERTRSGGFHSIRENQSAWRALASSMALAWAAGGQSS